MKKLTKAQLEAKLRAMQLEDMKDDMLPLDEMKQRALLEYNRRRQEEKRRKRRGIPQRLIVALSIAICLLLTGFLFSVFSPMTVSTANDFMKRAIIWIGDTLKLDVSIETPIEYPNDSSNDTDTRQVSFDSVEEASDYYDIPLLRLKNSVDGYTLTPPEAIEGARPFYLLEYSYRSALNYYILKYEKILDQSLATAYQEDSAAFETAIGTIYAWDTNGVTQGVFVSGQYCVYIKTSFSIDNFLEVMEQLEWLN